MLLQVKRREEIVNAADRNAQQGGPKNVFHGHLPLKGVEDKGKTN
jgi:hypothetical protein